MNSRRLRWVWFLVSTSSYIGGLRAQCVDFVFPDPDLNLTGIVTAAEITKVDLTFQVRELTPGCFREAGPFGVAVGKVDGATLCSIEYGNGQYGVPGQYCTFASKQREFRFMYTVNRCDNEQRLRWWTTNNIGALEKRITFNITYPPAITIFSVGGDPRLNVAEVQEGERLVFSCEWIPGNPQSAGYIYHYTKAESKLELARSGLTGNSITYIYGSVQCSDTGIVSCEVGGAGVSKALLVQCNNNSNTGTDEALETENSLSPTIITVVASVAAFGVAVVVVVVVVNIVCVRTGRCQPRRKLQPSEETLDVIPHRQKQPPAVTLDPIPRPGHRDPGLRTAHAHSNQSESLYQEILEEGNSGIYTEPYPNGPSTFVTGPGTYLTPTPNQRSLDQNRPTARPAGQNPRDHSLPIARTAGLHPREQNQPIPRPPTQSPRDITKPIVSPGSVLDGVRETSTKEAAGRGPHAATYMPLILSQSKVPSVYTAFKAKFSGDGLNEETTPKGVIGRPVNSLDEETTLKCAAWGPGNALGEETMPKFVTGN